jgi:hypothetical protein
MEPEEVTRLVVERLNVGDAAGVAALYEPQAVLAYPADRPTTGREAIQAVYQQMVDLGVRFDIETPLPTVGSRTWRRPRPARPTTPASMCRCCTASPMARGCGSSTTLTSQVTIYGWSTSEASPRTAENPP